MMTDDLDLFRPGYADPGALAARAPVLFRPVWNVSMNSVTGFVARVAEARTASDLRTGALDDMTVLARAGEMLEESLEIGLRAVIVAPVSAGTLLDHPCRGAWIGLLRRLPRRVRDLLALQVAAIPPGAPRERLQAAQRDVAALCRALVFSSDLSCAHLDCMPPRAVHACTADLAGLVPDRTGAAQLARFAGKTRALGCIPMAEGVATPPLFAAAAAAGFGYIAGPAAGADRSDIFQPRRA